MVILLCGVCVELKFNVAAVMVDCLHTYTQHGIAEVNVEGNPEMRVIKVVSCMWHV